MRNNCFILASTLGLLACAGKHQDGAGGHGGTGGSQAGTGALAGSGGGHAGAVAGAGSGGTTSGGGTGGSAGVSGTSGAAGQAGAGGTIGAGGTGTGGTTGAGGTGAIGTGGTGGTTGSGGAGGTAGQAGTGLRLLAGALGGPGYADDTGAAARFHYPARVASDGAGNIYVAEQLNYTIRKVAVATGTVTTLAGKPHEAGTEDGIGAGAGFSELKAITSDGAANLYVVDGHGIRKVVMATGAVTTLLDDTGAAAHIDDPIGIATDGVRYLYVADSGVDRYGMNESFIRKIDLVSGTVTTLADRTGVSIKLEDFISDIAMDGAGNLLVASGGTILKVVVATGAITTLAGVPGAFGSVDGTGAAARLGSESCLAADGAGNLFVADADFMTGGTVRKVVVATGAVTTIAGTAGLDGIQDGIGAAARFGHPAGVASDRAGNLYVADIWVNTIRKVAVATGAVTTLAGKAEQTGVVDATGASARFVSPKGVASDGAGNLYIADFWGHAIRKVVVATGAVTTLAGGPEEGSVDGTGAAARFYNPIGVAGDGAGNLFVTDSYVLSGGAIRKVVIATGAVTTLAGSADQPPGSTDGTGAAARFTSPSGIAFDGAGNLYVADGHSIRKIAVATRAVSTLAGVADLTGDANGTGTAARFNAPGGVVADGAGNLYVADTGNNTIRKIVIATRAVTTIAGTAGLVGGSDGTGAAARFREPNAIALDGAGNLYVGDGNGTVRQIVIAPGKVSTVIGSPGRIGVLLGALPAAVNGPSGIAVLSTGELAIVDTIENSVLIGHL